MSFFQAGDDIGCPFEHGLKTAGKFSVPMAVLEQLAARNASYPVTYSPWTDKEAATPSRREKHILLIFMGTRRVFDFLTSMTSLEVNF